MSDRKDLEEILNRVADRLVAVLRPTTEPEKPEAQTDTPNYGPPAPAFTDVMRERGAVLLPEVAERGKHGHRNGDLWKAKGIPNMHALRAGGKFAMILPEHINVSLPQMKFPDTSTAWTYLGNIFDGLISVERVRWALSAEDTNGNSVLVKRARSYVGVPADTITETRRRLREIGVIEEGK